MSPETRAVVSAHWRRRLGVDIDSLNVGEVRVRAHSAELAEYDGVYACEREGAMLVSAPPRLVRGLAARLKRVRPIEAFEPAFMASLLREAADRVIGPAWLGYAGRDEATALDAPGVRLMAGEDEPSLRALADAVGAEAWEHVGIAPGQEPIFGAFSGTELVAIASYRTAGRGVLHLGFVTHPSHRGKGHGRSVAAAATSHGLGTGAVMQWQTLVANEPSLRVASALGYEPYCRTIAIRLR